MLCPAWRPIQWCITWGSQHLKGRKIICGNLFFFIVLAAINGILSNTSQSLSALLTGITTNQHLLVQSHVCGNVCAAHGLLCFDISLL